MRLVVKYGGDSIGTPARMAAAARFLAERRADGEVVAVCSAVGRTTDALLGAAACVRRGDSGGARAAAARVVSGSRRFAAAVAGRPAARRRLLASLQRDFSELRGLVDGMVLIGEVTPRSLDYLLSFGERIAARTMAHAAAGAGAAAEALGGNEAGIVTDSNFGEARPLMDTTRLRVSRNLGALLEAGTMPVVGGFVGADQHGAVTTLGRGGSDYTATTIGTCIGADEIWLMGAARGLMSADPRLVKGARVLGEVSYVEAMEMALFGAKQIHPRTFEPLLDTKIPLRIRSSRDPGSRGTLVAASPSSDAVRTVKCVSTLRGNGLIDVRGGGMVGAPGTAARIFSTLAGAGVNVMMISQNPSESSISVVVKKSDMDGAVSALEMGLLGGIIKRLEVTPDVSIVALIGSGMRGTAGVASRVFGAIASRGINTVMITQGSSELNLAFVVRNDDCAEAVRVLHDEFGLAGGAPGPAP